MAVISAFLSLLLVLSSHAACVPETFYCSHNLRYYQASKADCSRFVLCENGNPQYFQCRQWTVFDFCQQKCVPVPPSCADRDHCFCSGRPSCVMQVQKPYDANQPQSLSVETPRVNPFFPNGIPRIDGPALPPSGPIFPPNIGRNTGLFGFNLNLLGYPGQQPYQPFQPYQGYQPYQPSFATNLGLQSYVGPAFVSFLPYNQNYGGYGGYGGYPFPSFPPPYPPSPPLGTRGDPNAVLVGPCSASNESMVTQPTPLPAPPLPVDETSTEPPAP